MAGESETFQQTEFTNNDPYVEEGKVRHDSSDEHIENPGKELQHSETRELEGVHETVCALVGHSTRQPSASGHWH